MKIEIELGDWLKTDLAPEIARWRAPQIVEFIKEIDGYHADWELIELLKPWVDEQYKIKLREDAQERKGLGQCYRDPDTEEEHHQSPHKGCILR